MSNSASQMFLFIKYRGWLRKKMPTNVTWDRGGYINSPKKCHIFFEWTNYSVLWHLLHRDKQFLGQTKIWKIFWIDACFNGKIISASHVWLLPTVLKIYIKVFKIFKSQIFILKISNFHSQKLKSLFSQNLNSRWRKLKNLQ